jgi:hypothetical protein
MPPPASEPASNWETPSSLLPHAAAIPPTVNTSTRSEEARSKRISGIVIRLTRRCLLRSVRGPSGSKLNAKPAVVANVARIKTRRRALPLRNRVSTGRAIDDVMKNGAMKNALAALLVAQGAIHLFGCARALGITELALSSSMTMHRAGFLWLLASISLIVGGARLAARSRHWAILAAPGLMLSQILMVASFNAWSFGTLSNLIILGPLALALFPNEIGDGEKAYGEHMANVS